MLRFTLLLMVCLAVGSIGTAKVKAPRTKGSKPAPSASPSDELKALASDYGIQLENLSIFATTEGSKTPLLDINAMKTMTPASVTKIITASAVLDSFPPDYRFTTQLLGNSSKKGSIFIGDLYLKGGGDPSFGAEGMQTLVDTFAKLKITKVVGDIVVDDSLFDSSRYDVSREQARVDHAYDAPVGAMSFGLNTVSIWIRPTKSGKKADVTIEPETDYIRVVSKAKTVSGRKNRLTAERRHSKKSGDLILINGVIGERYNPIFVEKNITQPDIWAGYNLKTFLAKKGIQVTGQIRNGLTAPNAKVLAEAKSKPIEEILIDMNKSSNNFVAEMLAKNLGTFLRPTGATLADGVRIINKHLKKIGLQDSEFKITNPAGLTHENKISSMAVWHILCHLQEDPRAQKAFFNSLPIAGVDGTLKTRNIASTEGTWVRAKTGYIRNVTALAGYAQKKNGKMITFSFVYNGAIDDRKVAKFFDQLLVKLL
ncbi:D-alanyl-D-alanine carboxypeptidase/D-alanyl-D-alanine-endopeptidase [Bdellovibrio sp. HCB2-146]|uniref:D-alanyl-D-alanine carboxypeptidase/D-alanyl-D-alanine endopeptidase n=1 Tax=Bdellovibrio sp. HCB2-146 TaxID=3394362 RepID=UPI0039BCDB91